MYTCISYTNQVDTLLAYKLAHMALKGSVVYVPTAINHEVKELLGEKAVLKTNIISLKLHAEKKPRNSVSE